MAAAVAAAAANASLAFLAAVVAATSAAAVWMSATVTRHLCIGGAVKVMPAPRCLFCMEKNPE